MISLKHNALPISTKLVDTRKCKTTKCSYDSKLQQKYKLLYHINMCDKFLKINYDKALTICDVKQSIESQPECKQCWQQLESYAIIRNELRIQLQHIYDQLAEYE